MRIERIYAGYGVVLGNIDFVSDAGGYHYHLMLLPKSEISYCNSIEESGYYDQVIKVVLNAETFEVLQEFNGSYYLKSAKCYYSMQ